MALTHTPDTDVIAARRNAMIDALAWEMIGLADDRAQEIIDLANDRAHSILRHEPTPYAAVGRGDGKPGASSSTVLALPLPSTSQPPGGSAVADAAPSSSRRKSGTTATSGQPPAADPDTTTGDGNRGSVKAAVLAHLRSQPGVAITVSTVAKAVGKAAGSVGAALESLTKSGDIARVGDSPKAYAWSEQG